MPRNMLIRSYAILIAGELPHGEVDLPEGDKVRKGTRWIAYEHISID